MTMARDCQATMPNRQAPGNPSLLDGVRELIAPRPTATTEIGEERSDPMAATGSGVLIGAEHGYLLHPQCASRRSRLAANVTDSPWARHQQRAQSLNKTSTRPSGAVYRDVHYRKPGLEYEGTVPCQQYAPRQRYQASMDTPDDASEEDASPTKHRHSASITTLW